jgi:hypothetical protein
MSSDHQVPIELNDMALRNSDGNDQQRADQLPNSSNAPDEIPVQHEVVARRQESAPQLGRLNRFGYTSSFQLPTAPKATLTSRIGALRQEVQGTFQSPIYGETVIEPGQSDPQRQDHALATAVDYFERVRQVMNEVMQRPTELKDPTLYEHFVGLLMEVAKLSGALASNFTAYSAFSAANANTTDGLLGGKAGYMAVSLMLDTFSPDLISRASRFLGGLETKTYLNTKPGTSGRYGLGAYPGRSAVGAQNENMGRALLGIVGVFTYGIITSAISTSDLDPEPRIGVSTASGVVGASIVAYLMTCGLSHNTLKSLGVASHQALPGLRHYHGRDMPVVSTFFNRPAAYNDRTTDLQKGKEIALRGMSAAVKAGMIFLFQATANKVLPDKNPSQYQAFTVFVSFALGAVIQTLANAVILRAYSDPTEHRRRFQIIANEVVCAQLRQSALTLRAEVLNTAGNALRGPAPVSDLSEDSVREADDADKKPRQLYQMACELMRPDAPSRFPHSIEIEHIKGLLRFFQEQKQLYKQNVDKVGALSKGSVYRASELIQFIEGDLTRLEIIKSEDIKDEAYGPLFTDMVQRTRELSMLLYHANMLAGEAQNDSPAAEPVDPHIAELTQALIPVMAAIQRGDRLALADQCVTALTHMHLLETLPITMTPGPLVSLVRAMSSTDDMTTLKKTVLKPFSARADKKIFGTDLMDSIMRELETRLTHGEFLETMTKGLSGVRRLAESDHAEMTVVYVMNRIAALTSVQSTENAKELIKSMYKDGNSVPGQLESVVDHLLDKIAEGRVDALELARFLSETPEPVTARNDEGLEAAREAGISPAELEFQRHVARLRSDLGPERVKTLLEEAGIIEMSKLGEVLLSSIAMDVSQMHHMVRTVLEVGLNLSRAPGARIMTVEEQRDAHQHHDNFNGLTVALKNQDALNKAANIISAAYMSIPHQILGPTENVVYYGNNPKSWVYASKEATYVNQVKDPHVLSFTGLNLHVPEKIREQIISAIRLDPEHKLGWIGEVSGLKISGITDNGLDAVAPVEAWAKYVFLPAAQLGFGITMHHDIGEAHGELEHGDRVLNAFLHAKHLIGSEMDILATGDKERAPPDAKLKLIIPHFGMSPQNSGGPNLAKFWSSTFDDKRYDGLLTDASWAPVTKNIAADIRDSLKSISPQLATAFDTIITSYSFFQKEGGLADKLTDLKMPDTAALYKVSSDSAAEFYISAIANQQEIVVEEMKKPAVRNAVIVLIHDERYRGNNWLNLFYKHSDRILFGTDNLASEVKIHGQSELVIDTLALHPLYALFNELSRKDENDQYIDQDGEKYAQVVPNVARDNWVQAFNDEELRKRREAAHEYYTKSKPSEGRRAPDNVVRYVQSSSSRGDGQPESSAKRH